MAKKEAWFDFQQGQGSRLLFKATVWVFGPTQSPILSVPAALFSGKDNDFVKLTTHLYLVPKLQYPSIFPSRPPSGAFIKWTRAYVLSWVECGSLNWKLTPAGLQPLLFYVLFCTFSLYAGIFKKKTSCMTCRESDSVSITFLMLLYCKFETVGSRCEQ